jgi:hypothetical protein
MTGFEKMVGYYERLVKDLERTSRREQWQERSLLLV